MNYFCRQTILKPTKMKRLFLSLVAMMGVLTLSAQSVYDFKVKNEAGQEVSLADYRGKVLLIVNTATKCGFTPQYKELQQLYKEFAQQGFEILDFPCNQFGSQAPGSIQEIHQFCTSNFDITFPQFDKIEVNGANAHPLYVYLKSQQGFGGFDLNDKRGKMLDGMFRKQNPDYDKNADIKWNFTKFLVSADGRVLKRYEPSDPMSQVKSDIAVATNPVVKTILERRSIRMYKDTPVEHEKLQAIATCGINAPSGMNRQPWLIRIVEDQQLIAEVTEVYKQANAKQVERDKNFKNMFRNAPNLICVCTPAQGGGELDAGILGQNMVLAAQSLGLGTCYLGGPVRFLNSNEKARFFLDRLDIPADYRLNYILAIGYPDEQPAPRPRDDKKVKFIK